MEQKKEFNEKEKKYQKPQIKKHTISIKRLLASNELIEGTTEEPSTPPT